MKTINRRELLLLIFIPTFVLNVVYFVLGHFVKMPNLLLFCILATFTMMPIELGIIINASKKETGKYSLTNINLEDGDAEDIKKYKDLLNKEYSFCLKVMDEVIGKANKLYDKQMVTGKVVKFCCDFKALEEAADE